MFEVSKEIVAFFSGLTEFSSVMNANLFALVAKADTPYPFCTFIVSDQTPLTKCKNQNDVTFYAYFSPEQYDQAAQFTDAMTQKIEESQFQWQSSRIDFFEEDQSIVGVISFKII
jgi:hypothetical protein